MRASAWHMRKRRAAAAAARAWVCTVTSVFVYSSPFDHRSATSDGRKGQAPPRNAAPRTRPAPPALGRSAPAAPAQRDAALSVTQPRGAGRGERAPCRAACRQPTATRPDTRGRAARGACIPPAWRPCAAARGPAARPAPPLRSISWRQQRTTSTQLPQRACQQAAVHEHGVARHAEPRSSARAVSVALTHAECPRVRMLYSPACRPSRACAATWRSLVPQG